MLAEMRYKRHANYNDPGFHWLDAIPSGWSVTPLKYAVDFNPEVLANDTLPEYGFRYIDISSVTQRAESETQNP